MKTHLALRMYFERKKKATPGFSLRSLAGRLEISASFLSRVLSGKKPIPADLLAPLARALDVEPELLAGLESELKEQSQMEKVTAEIEDWSISEKTASQVLRNWYNVPILELITLSNYDGSAEQIARRLGLSLATTEVALRELTSHGLVQVVDGRYAKSHHKLRVTSSKSIAPIRNFHDQMLERSQQELRNSITDEDFNRRLITGITISADPEMIQDAKRRLAEFLHELANDLVARPGSEVYHLAAQLFPLSKGR